MRAAHRGRDFHADVASGGHARGLRIVNFRTFTGVAETPQALGELKSPLDGTVVVPGMPLKPLDQAGTRVIGHLIEMSDPECGLCSSPRAKSHGQTGEDLKYAYAVEAGRLTPQSKPVILMSISIQTNRQGRLDHAEPPPIQQLGTKPPLPNRTCHALSMLSPTSSSTAKSFSSEHGSGPLSTASIVPDKRGASCCATIGWLMRRWTRPSPQGPPKFPMRLIAPFLFARNFRISFTARFPPLTCRPSWLESPGQRRFCWRRHRLR